MGDTLEERCTMGRIPVVYPGRLYTLWYTRVGCTPCGIYPGMLGTPCGIYPGMLG